MSETKDAYNEIIKILQECAKEEGISEELVKEIYDLERGQTHLPSRANESDLRGKLLDQVKDTDTEAEDEKKEEEDAENDDEEDAEDEEAEAKKKEEESNTE